jgi:hypothetical protein
MRVLRPLCVSLVLTLTTSSPVFAGADACVHASKGGHGHVIGGTPPHHKGGKVFPARSKKVHFKHPRSHAVLSTHLQTSCHHTKPRPRSHHATKSHAAHY